MYRTLSRDQASELDRLFRLYRKDVERFLRARSHSGTPIDDLVAETFLCAGSAIADGNTVSIGWLVTVARRRLVDHWRYKARRPVLDDAIEDIDCPIGGGQSRVADRLEIKGAIDTLTSRQGRALGERYLREQSVAQVSETLGCSYKATESVLARARRGFIDAYGAHD